MRLTPIEIRRHRFHTRLRGLDREEVRTFLEMIVADFEEIVRENAQLRRETERLTRDLEGYRGKESSIHETMTTAQGVVAELKHTAIKESELIVATAEVQAEKVLQEVEARRADLESEIRQMQHIRRQVEVDLRKVLEGYESMLDAYQQALPRVQLPCELAPKTRPTDPTAGGELPAYEE